MRQRVPHRLGKVLVLHEGKLVIWQSFVVAAVGGGWWRASLLGGSGVCWCAILVRVLCVCGIGAGFTLPKSSSEARGFKKEGRCPALPLLLCLVYCPPPRPPSPDLLSCTIASIDRARLWNRNGGRTICCNPPAPVPRKSLPRLP